MSEPGAPDQPPESKGPAWLRFALWLASLRGNAGGAKGSDGSALSGSSQLESGKGINQKPDLKSGESGGGTAPSGQKIPPR